MKDYSMTKEERDNFILGFDPNGSTITAKFANGNDLPLPNNDKNEQILLGKMNKQVESSDEFYKEKVNQIKGLSRWLKIFIPCFGISTAILIIYIISNVPIVVPVLFEGLMGAGTVAIALAFLKSKFVLNDLVKNRQFREIEDKLNENIRKTNENVLANTSKKMKQFVEKAPENKPVFNINSFNYVPYSDIQQVMDNIKRNEDFGFDYSDIPTNEQGKTRMRKR